MLVVNVIEARNESKLADRRSMENERRFIELLDNQQKIMDYEAKLEEMDKKQIERNNAMVVRLDANNVRIDKGLAGLDHVIDQNEQCRLRNEDMQASLKRVEAAIAEQTRLWQAHVEPPAK